VCRLFSKVMFKGLFENVKIEIGAGKNALAYGAAASAAAVAGFMVESAACLFLRHHLFNKIINFQKKN
jgi:hypothetical protein